MQPNTIEEFNDSTANSTSKIPQVYQMNPT